MKHPRAFSLPRLSLRPLRQGLSRVMPQQIVSAFAVAAVALLYLVQLGRFIAPSVTERQVAMVNGDLSNLIANPVNLPYKALDLVMLHLPIGSVALRSRLASAAIALLCCGLFYLLARRWHGTRNGILATLLFVPSSWMLHTGRFGAGLIMLTAVVLALVCTASWVSNAEADGKVVVWYAALCAIALTVPAGLWFVIATTLIIRKVLAEHVDEASGRQLLLAGSLLAAAVLIAAAATVRDTAVLGQWLGLPAVMPEWLILAKQAVQSLTFSALRGPFMPEIWLAHTPLLDGATTVLFIFGALFYLRHRSSARVVLLAVFALIAIALVSLHGAPALAYLVPLLYLVAATGLAALSHQWLKVFPRNPIARNSAIVLVAVLAVVTASYHGQRYFVAWRHSPDTAEAYRIDDSALSRSNLVQ